MEKKTFDLLCSVGELTSLFQKSTNIKGLLQLVVRTIASHMHTHACAIFLLEKESNLLVMRATVGFNEEMIDQIKLHEGEGITGTALEQGKPICVGRGSEDPHFKHVPGIFEEKYESFLAVPIIHSSTKLGVIVMEDERADYYTDRDIRALTAIASQLATFLEHANMLIELRQTQARHGEAEEEAGATGRGSLSKSYYTGKATSGGICQGWAVVVSGNAGNDLIMHIAGEEYEESMEGFERAIELTKRQLEEMQSHMEERLSEAGSLIFGSHLLMLSDEEFSGSMREHIRAGMKPSEAIGRVVNDYVHLFQKSDNVNIREKIHDVEDLGHRLLRNLSGRASKDGDYSGQIVVADNLLPSELVKLAAQNVEGFIIRGTGLTSHISILSRSLNIPTVLLSEDEFFEHIDDTYLIVDAFQGSIIIEPEQEVIERYRNLQEEMSSVTGEEAEEPAGGELSNRCTTADGEVMELLANINLLSDLESARKAGTKGVGLYRSEYLFLVRNDFPPEEEQYLIYRRLMEQMEPVFFRTMDIGGDKFLSVANIKAEENPFMGLRAIRYALEKPEAFKPQLRALLRAGSTSELRILFPLIAGLDDFICAREMTMEAVRELREEGIEHNGDPLFGAMIELPSAAMLSEELAGQADFLSIGTNDLVQYVLGVDRTNNQVTHLYSPYHPAVLKTLKQIVDAARQHDTPVSVCGDSAGDPGMLTFFLGIGIRSFSVDPRLLPQVRSHIEAIELYTAQEAAQRMLAAQNPEEAKACIPGLSASTQ
jgi:phosphotransferase system enzyme I (PtsP)